MIETSLNEYLRLINEATEMQADIIVFPEGSLNYFGIATRIKLTKYAVELNETDIYNSTSFNNVCDYSGKSSVRVQRTTTCWIPKLKRTKLLSDFVTNFLQLSKKSDLRDD